MKHNSMNNFKPHSTFYMIPAEVMDELLEVVKDLRELRTELTVKGKSDALGDYISEEEAMEILKRGKTWFWNMRKTGKLLGKKAAGRWYYQLDAITNFIENGKSNF